jgi:dihydrodipicolinate synthase/N-acetylneuraminate lyase
MAELAGLYAALPTAFDVSLAYDGTAQAALARHARSLGMEGFFVGDSTAEVHSLSLGERLAGLRDEAEALASGT